jgi:dTMP kinase
VKPGTLIAFEGIDGCGKSTQARRLERALAAAGHATLLTREPSDGPFGQRIRELARAGRRVAPEEELLVFTEDRRSHVAEVIAPALAEGRVVVTDRYYLSTVAYQGARGLDPEAILEASEREFPAPDLALVLELDPATALARVRGRADGALTAFEREEELAAVRHIFRSIDRPYVERVDATADEDAVHARVLDAVRRRLKWELA